MIKLLLILFSISILVSSSPPSFGLKTPYGEPLELLELKMKAFVEGPYKEIQYLSTYRNSKDSPVEAVFSFPYSEDLIFHNFEAKFGNQTIVGKITARKNNYTRIAPYDDVDSIKIGQIQTNETVQILFSIIQPLQVLLNKFYEVKFPAIFDIQDLAQWDIQVEIKSKKPFLILSNPTHRIKPEQKNSTNPNIYKAIWNVTIPTDKDFIVYFAPEGFGELEFFSATHPENPNDHAFLFHAVPDMRYFDHSFAQNALENPGIDGLAALQKIAFRDYQQYSPSQYVFMIDRSETRKGASFETFKKALIEILQALQEVFMEDRTVQILSFGSTVEFYTTEDKRPPNLREAIEYARTLEADMGKKDLFNAMHFVRENWDSMNAESVIILTDGGTGDSEEIIEMVSESSDNFRTCILGIGNRASKEFIKEIGIAGKCWSEFVADNEDLGEKVHRLIQESISRYGPEHEFYFECWDNAGKVVHEFYVEGFTLRADQSFNKWMYLDNILDFESCKMEFRFSSQRRSLDYEKKMKITSFENSEIPDFYHKIAYHERIKLMQRKLKEGSLRDAQSEKQWGRDKSIQYQILSDFTQLFPVLQETKKFNEREIIQSFDL